ncbi:MAG: endonuclease/exonuclease/phosphatase family protein [Phycisphaerales bacterium JB052]
MDPNNRVHSVFLLAMASLVLSMWTPVVSAQPVTEEELVERIEVAEQSMRRFGIAEAPAKTPGAFRLTTYNIENLFDDVDDPTLSGDNEDIDDAKPHHQMLAAARAIRQVDADVLCIEEVESIDALNAFIEKYIPDMGYEHVISLDAGNSRGIENAVLSRYPLSNPQLWIGKELGGVHPDNYGPNAKNYYAGEPIAFRRSPLKVDVEIPSGDEQGSSWTLTLFVVHHKSGYYSGYWREAEARTIAKLAHAVESEHPGRPIVILGDFNAQPSDESVKIYLRDGFNDLFANARPGDKSAVTHESNRRIDLMLLNEAAKARMVKGSGFVLGTAARPEGINWRDLDTFEGYAADHYPLSAEFQRGS